jgi:malonate-semialdehyde dehydrogenase (acetylating)/methylmalonate-semialdehyde dehydrogenase
MFPPTSDLADTEIFGPCSASFTPTHGRRARLSRTQRLRQPGVAVHVERAAARRFRYEAPAGNIGINIGVAAPMAYFPFSGWKDSFFGDLHGQGRDAIEFYTDKESCRRALGQRHSRKVLVFS